MIAGANYLEFSHDKDVVTMTIRENGITTTAHLAIHQAAEARSALAAHLQAAAAWRPPSLIEYTGPTDKVSS